MSAEGRAAIIGFLVFISLLLVPLLIIVIVNYTKRTAKEKKKPDGLSEGTDLLFPSKFDSGNAKSPIHDGINAKDITIIYEYETKTDGLKACQYCGVENDVYSNRCCVCGNKLD